MSTPPLADQISLVLEMGIFGEVEAIVLYHEEPRRLTGVYVQFNGHLINTLPRLPLDGHQAIWATIESTLEPEPELDDSPNPDTLLTELSYGGSE
jgi:hypothetical protein